MKERIENLQKDRLISRFIIATFVLMFLTLSYIFFKYREIPPLIPLFNQLPWGERRLSEGWGIFLPLLAVFIIFLMNIFLSAVSYNRTPLVSRMFAVTSFVVSFLAFLFIVRTIQLIS